MAAATEAKAAVGGDAVAEARRLGELAREAAALDDSLEVRGIVWFEHVNIVIGDRRLAEIFYLEGLGLTLDNGIGPTTTMWINAGPRQQFHLAQTSETKGNPQVVDGCIGLALPDLPALLARLSSVAEPLKGSQFAFTDLGTCVEVFCPWGNRFFVYSTAATMPADAPAPRTRMEAAHASLDHGMSVRGDAGIRYFQWRCTDATAVGHFYEDVFGCVVRYSPSDAVVCVGPSTHFIFTTTPSPRDPQQLQLAKGVHVCVYICNFKQAHDRLKEHNLIWTNQRFKELDTCTSYEEAASGRQWRFKIFRDLRSGGTEEIAELEHEVRSLRHLQFLKHVPYTPK